MTQKTLVVNVDLDEKYLHQLKEIAPNWRIVNNENLDDLKTAEVVLHWNKKSKDILLQENTNLRWIQVWSAGVNGLPLEQLEQKDVFLTSANGVHAFPISETIFALMLSLTRKIHTYVRQQQQKQWDNANLKLEMHQKTIGIIGVGEIGQETAKIAKAFGMKVLGVRHSGKETAYVDHMYTQDQLSQVLPQCDYVVVTLPLTNQTREMFAASQFNQMKKSAFFINIGRGAIVREQNLIEALQDNKIAGAGLDVFATEPLPDDSPLWKMENVIVTPHSAGATEQYDQRVLEDIFIPNFKEYLKSKKPNINVVDYKKGY
ncbi:D-2-hydroxyacid dehydrogenase [Gracilibacillus massiliensis]|uniref:D-2-hydroxyacid dehydrogenase n=1 Tax=Gracilibacillus massiliensis TaxID=1564956 RepID=UPI00071C465E|nr:D-2-hydroxyacid dehydrogenase [Gracilibacillus massiliensis]